VEDLTVVLVSNGETPISGTPFDADINARLRNLAPQMKKTKTTLNLALVAQEGKLVAWAMNAPGFLLEIPVVPPRPPKPLKPEVSARTNATVETPAAIAKVATPALEEPVPAAKPRPRTLAPIVITKETVAQEKRSYQAITGTTTNDHPAPETNAPEANKTAALAGAKTNDIPVLVDVTPATPPPPPAELLSAATLVSSDSATSKVPAAIDRGTVEKSPATNLGAMAPGTPAAPSKGRPAMEPVAVETSEGLHPLLWAALGAAGAFACGLAGFLLARRRQEPSLISQAIAQQRLGRP
jgi:hypothetical protein